MVAVNEFMTLINPGIIEHDFIHRTLISEYSMFELPPVGDLTLDLSKSKPYLTGEFITSGVLGKGERSRPDTWRQAIASLSHRNYSAPRVNERLDTFRTAELLCESLLTAFDVSKLYECYDYIIPDIYRIDQWLADRDVSKFNRIKRDMNHSLMYEQFSTMKMMIKGELKPKMDLSSYTTYAPPANIIYYKHIVSMFFSPLFLEVFDRITYCLSNKVVMYSGINLDTLGRVIRSRLPLPIENYHTLEIDFSKFDKSQGCVFKLYEGMIYRFLKFSEEAYLNIETTEYFCKFRSASGLTGELGAQRRTGSPNTWLSNTLVTMGMLLNVYNLDDIDLMLVSGDDSLIFSRKPLENKTNEININFGFEAKFVENSVPYFCSKYIVDDRGTVKVVPDPVRFFEKLSVPVRLTDFLAETTLREKFVSYKDLMKEFDNDTVCLLVDILVCKRYSLPPMTSYAALCFIHCLCANFASFKKIFDEIFVVDI
nr:RNA-dependant RNA polymerase [Sweet potato chlorotic stunt virus]